MLTAIGEYYIFLQARQIQFTMNVPQCVLQTEYKVLAHLATGMNLDYLEKAVISVFARPAVACIRSYISSKENLDLFHSLHIHNTYCLQSLNIF